MEENKKEEINIENKSQETEAKNIKAKSQGVKVGNILNIIIKAILNLIYVLLVVIVIILIYNIIQVSILNRPYMNIFGYSFFQVKTGSMSGTMEKGDIIIVKLTKEVEENDIITHRIIEKQEEQLITKGDANNAEDDPITTDEIIGKVVYIVKNVEIWKNVFKAPEVYTLVIITLVLFGITGSISEKKEE